MKSTTTNNESARCGGFTQNHQFGRSALDPNDLGRNPVYEPVGDQQIVCPVEICRLARLFGEECTKDGSDGIFTV